MGESELPPSLPRINDLFSYSIVLFSLPLIFSSESIAQQSQSRRHIRLINASLPDDEGDNSLQSRFGFVFLILMIKIDNLLFKILAGQS